MNTRTLRSDVLLLLTAFIWGTAFVAQRVGMAHVGPFTYSGIRFVLGTLVLLPLICFRRRSGAAAASNGTAPPPLWRVGLLAGSALFCGVSLQQVGLVYTTAGKAGFITGLYVVIVPLLGLFWRQHTHAGTWTGAVLAVAGLYLLSITADFTIAFGDLLELLGAFFWAAHVLIIAWLSPRRDPLELAAAQFSFCAALSLATALLFERFSFSAILDAAVPILYGGILSVGIAYTLQVVAQRSAPPAHAAIILCLETVFAAWGGWIVLGETLDARGILGCTLMLSGMLLSQLWGLRARRSFTDRRQGRRRRVAVDGFRNR